MTHDPELKYRFVELGSAHSLAAFKSVYARSPGAGLPAASALIGRGSNR